MKLPKDSQVQFRLGPLVCEGEKVISDPPGSSCVSLRAIGVASSHYYVLKKDSDFILAYCDMTKNDQDKDIEKQIAKITLDPIKKDSAQYSNGAQQVNTSYGFILVLSLLYFVR